MQSSLAIQQKSRGGLPLHGKLGKGSQVSPRRVILRGHTMRTSTLTRATSVAKTTNPISKEQVAKDIQAIILKFDTGTVAQSAGCTKAAVKKWRAGDASPDCAATLNLAMGGILAAYVSAQIRAGGRYIDPETEQQRAAIEYLRQCLHSTNPLAARDADIKLKRILREAD